VSAAPSGQTVPTLFTAPAHRAAVARAAPSGAPAIAGVTRPAADVFRRSWTPSGSVDPPAARTEPEAVESRVIAAPSTLLPFEETEPEADVEVASEAPDGPPRTRGRTLPAAAVDVVKTGDAWPRRSAETRPAADERSESPAPDGAPAIAPTRVPAALADVESAAPEGAPKIGERTDPAAEVRVESEAAADP
jgi:hypothetical protein